MRHTEKEIRKSVRLIQGLKDLESFNKIQREEWDEACFIIIHAIEDGYKLVKEEKIENHEEYKANLISLLNKIKEYCPEQEILIEAPNNGNHAILGKANIYEDIRGAIVIDVE